MTATNQTTLAAMQAGNPRLAFVIALDGYPSLISSAPEAAVQTAWASTDWATKSVIGGVTIELDNHQQLNPWNPFEGGGKLVFRVLPDANDTFGIDVARTDSGAETLLDETVDRVQPLFVGLADGFALTGDAHCGVECFDYHFISGRTLKGTPGLTVGSNRGKYVAHGVKDSTTTYGAIRFSDDHRVATANGVPFKPVVSQQPRTWTGRRVSLWAHTYDPSTGALNTKENALCLFVGEITEPQDEENGSTSVLCEHLLNRIPKTTLLRDQWTARVDYGIRLQAGQKFKFKDGISGSGTWNSATDLTVVASGGDLTYNTVDAGAYAHEEMMSILNGWLGGEVAAGRILGNYTFTCPEDDNGTPRSILRWFIPGSTSSKGDFILTWPFPGWAQPFGYNGSANYSLTDVNTLGQTHRLPSPGTVHAFSFVGTGDVGNTMRIPFEASEGTFQPQNTTLPAAAKSLLGAFLDVNDWGIFQLECETPLTLLATVSGNELRQIRVLGQGFGENALGKGELAQAKVPLGSAPPTLRQVFVHEAALKTMMKYLAYSTGTPGYNHPDFDVLPIGQGLNLAYDMLGDDFEQSCDALPGANDLLTVTLAKPRTFADAFKADLVIRNAHLVFREGKFKFVSWTSPSDATATTVLDESNKAEPIDVRVSHRSTSVLDSSWVKNYCKINYNCDASQSVGGGEDVFASPPIILEDATSIDDMGGKPLPVTLDLRNVYQDSDQIGQGVRQLAANFLAWMPWWSRPLWKMRRSIAPTLYEGFGVGDVVAVTDPHVRDPETGRRGITTRPGIVVGHRYQLQTAAATGKVKFAGEVDVVFLHNDRTFAIAPAAEVDETADTGGFINGFDGVSTFHFKQNEHSEPTENQDLLSFSNGDAVRFIEIDPDDPATVETYSTHIDTIVDDTTAVMTTNLGGVGLSTATKRWRMVYDVYANVQSQQTIKSFQAGTTLAISAASTIVPADRYGMQTSSIAITEYDHTRLPELMSNASFGPNTGAPRDAGYDKELGLLIENMFDRQTARSSPSLTLDTEASSNTANNGWQLLRVEMRYIGHLIYGGGVNRYLWIAPRWRTDGSGSATPGLRVWISGYPPAGTSNVNLDSSTTPGYTISAPAAGNLWNRSASDTSWVNDLPQAYPIGNFNGHDFVFVIVEGQKSVSFQGLHQFSYGERFSL